MTNKEIDIIVDILESKYQEILNYDRDAVDAMETLQAIDIFLFKLKNTQQIF
jgi:hypothetical protein